MKVSRSRNSVMPTVCAQNGPLFFTNTCHGLNTTLCDVVVNDAQWETTPLYNESLSSVSRCESRGKQHHSTMRVFQAFHVVNPEGNNTTLQWESFKRFTLWILWETTPLYNESLGNNTTLQWENLSSVSRCESCSGIDVLSQHTLNLDNQWGSSLGCLVAKHRWCNEIRSTR